MVRSRQRGDGSCGLVWEAPFRQHLLELLPLAPLLARVAVAPGSELLQELLPRGCASGLTDGDESRHRDALGIVQGLRPLAIHNAAPIRMDGWICSASGGPCKKTSRTSDSLSTSTILRAWRTRGIRIA